MASRREQAGLPKGAEMRALVLDLLRTMPMPIRRTEIGDAVAGRLGLSESQRAVLEPGDRPGRTYVAWRSEYTCNDFKWIGVCEQPGPGLYQITEIGRSISQEEVERRHRERRRRSRIRLQEQREAESGTLSANDADDEEDLDTDWRADLLNRLADVSPTAFEHLSGALLLAAGFDDVEVTGRGGDGGIDGIGVYRPSGLISFQTAFQCKRYKGSVGASTVRDFRGSFVGRSDRGIVITTGTFTRDARAEAARPGAHPIDLIDGEALCDLLKQHKLGVQTQMVEEVAIDDSYFAQFEDSR